MAAATAIPQSPGRARRGQWREWPEPSTASRHSLAHRISAQTKAPRQALESAAAGREDGSVEISFLADQLLYSVIQRIRHIKISRGIERDPPRIAKAAR